MRTVYVNGKFCPEDEAKISIFDRGLLFADAVYEVIASYSGKLFRLDAHLARMENGMRELAYPHVSMDEIRALRGQPYTVVAEAVLAPLVGDAFSPAELPKTTFHPTDTQQ